MKALFIANFTAVCGFNVLAMICAEEIFKRLFFFISFISLILARAA